MGRKVVSGWNGLMGHLFMDSNEFCAEDWEINEVGEESDTTNTCGEGFDEQEVGSRRLEGTINYTWDAEKNAFSVAPTMAVGTKHPNTRMYPNSDGDDQTEPHFGLTLHVLNHRVGVPVKGKVAGTITFKSHGRYTLPSGAISESGI